MLADTPLAVREVSEFGYELLDLLHRSRGYDVYDAWSMERHCRCVIKTPRADRLDDPKLWRRLEQEGRLLYRLTHPHILRGYDVIPGPPPAVVTETLRGQTLEYILEHSRRLTAAEAAVLGMQLCSAVAYLHQQGYLHLDLKPSNIVIDGGRAIVIDLSIAREPGPGTPGLGTWAYLAPEQALGDQLGPAADAWGIGVVLYEALTGRPLFGEGEDDEVGDSELFTDSFDPEDYPQLQGRVPGIGTVRRLPAGLATAVDACLDPDASCRPSLLELSALLETVPGAGSPRALQLRAGGD
jgi:eukaryotic-like serine/threonine-protein kinase